MKKAKPSYDVPEDFPRMRELRSLEAKLIQRDIKAWLDKHGEMINTDLRREIAKLCGILALFVAKEHT